jgi:UDPglucose 6-dehydrogenase
MRIVMLGSGYVGLVSGACFADFGHFVTCVDRAADKISQLDAGHIPIYEPGLGELVARSRVEGRLSFTTDLTSAAPAADAIFIAVGTPSRRGDGHADLSYVYAAARELAPLIKGHTLIVTKSTVPVGTGDEIERIIRGLRPDADFAVVSNPEFLREGSAIEDFKRPDRIVVGTDDPRAQKIMADIYRPLHLNQGPLLFTDRRSSELIKYAANAFLAIKITFINEIADLCEKVGANVQDVARGVGLDGRIGSKFLHAGPGFGGSCFPKDSQALIKTAEDFDSPLRIVETMARVNDERKNAMGRRVIAACGGSVEGKTIAVLGLTFKPNTDDMRDSPALSIVGVLQREGAAIRAFDPKGIDQARLVLSDIDYAPDAYSCLAGADALVIVTEWEQFRALDLPRVRQLLRQPIVVDLRNIYRPEEMAALGFDYSCIGRNLSSLARSEPPRGDLRVVTNNRA